MRARRVARPILAGATVLVLAAGGLFGASVGAQENPPDAVTVQSSPEQVQRAQGVIVTRPRGVSLRELRKQARRSLKTYLPDRRIVQTIRADRRSASFILDASVTAEQAGDWGRAMVSKGIVNSAVPDLLIMREPVKRTRGVEPVPATGELMATAASTQVVDPATVTDPFFLSQQWYLQPGSQTGAYSAGFTGAWRTTMGDASVIVAVIDDGITPHPDLDSQIVGGYDFVSNAAKALDGNGWDSNPRNEGTWVTAAEVANDPLYAGCKVENSDWHGSHVAGIIAAAANGRGIVGAAPGVRIQPIRVFGKCHSNWTDLIAAIRWAAGDNIPGAPVNPKPARVINMSLGATAACFPQLQEAVDFAVGRGITVVAAAGNDDTLGLDAPANCANVLRVTSVDHAGARASYSNYASNPDFDGISATGGDVDNTLPDPKKWSIYSTVNLGTERPSDPAWDSYEGTSMATPLVSAAAALLVSKWGAATATPDWIAQTLATQARGYPASPGGSNANQPCTNASCGRGILTMDNIFPVPGLPASPSPITKGVWRNYSKALKRVLLTWPTPASESQIVDYFVTITRTREGPGDRWQDISYPVTTPQVSLKLAKGKTYEVTIETRARAGNSSPSQIQLTVPLK